METKVQKNIVSDFLLNDTYRIWRHILLQAVIFLITIGIFFDAPDKITLSLNRFYGWISYFLLLDVLVYFNAYVLCPLFLLKRKFSMYIIATVIFTIVASSVTIVLQQQFYDIAVISQEPSVVAIIFSIASSFFAIILFLGGISALLLFRQWLNENIRAKELEAATLQTELMFLKSQINPHFLFNMLNNANILVDEDPEMASHILLKLDELISYQMKEATRDKVYLMDDIGFLGDFLELEKTRRDHFDYTITYIEEDVKKAEVASLLFIPFVENAVKHNTDSEGLSYVRVSFTIEKDKLKFTCVNSIPQKETGQKKNGGLGLANIKRRLELLYKDHYKLEQIKTDKTYTVNLELKL